LACVGQGRQRVRGMAHPPLVPPHQQFPARGFPFEKTLFLISHFANPSRIMLA
jgi:hypothetical protein